MELTGSGVVQLDDPVEKSFSEWQGADRESVTVRHLLDHSSGLPDRLFEQAPPTAREFAHDICTMPLEYAPGSRSIYSDLGFILLGLLASHGGGQMLASQFDEIRDRLADADPALGAAPLTYASRLVQSRTAAPTWPEDDDARRGRTLVGEIHDAYASILGDAAGHAGLFGTAASVGAFARLTLRAARGDAQVPEPLSPDRVRAFTAKSGVPGSSRALGWDTMLPTSSCGSRMSPAAFGHVGFTGTSMWIDPARDRYYVLLTNRAFHGGTLNEMRDVRRSFHDALADL
jgi:CubicO group peptidase (beta-lactamase class C family)